MKIKIEQFIEKCSIIHNNKYSYENTILGKYNREKVKIICPIHGEFLRRAFNHLKGSGCANCNTIRIKTKHGLRNHKYYRIWDGVMQRCYNPKATSYKNYGARGICVSEEFKDCKTFICYLESLPGYLKKMELDRIDNNGNYERNNLKWATRQEQTFNTRVRKDNISNYTGVCKQVRSLKWRAYLNIDGKKQKHLGVYDTIKEAVEARNKYIIDNNLKHKIQTYIDNPSILNAYPDDRIK